MTATLVRDRKAAEEMKQLDEREVAAMLPAARPDYITHRHWIIVQERLIAGRSYGAIAAEWGVTHERIRQIVHKAMGRIRFHAGPVPWWDGLPVRIAHYLTRWGLTSRVAVAEAYRTGAFAEKAPRLGMKSMHQIQAWLAQEDA